jgi:hypothetical protein
VCIRIRVVTRAACDVSWQPDDVAIWVCRAAARETALAEVRAIVQDLGGTLWGDQITCFCGNAVDAGILAALGTMSAPTPRLSAVARRPPSAHSAVRRCRA